MMEDVEKSQKKRGVVTVKVREEEERWQKLKLDEDGPTKEEVDQFFAILRRMKLALHHFHCKPNDANHWRELLKGTDISFGKRRYPPVKNNVADVLVVNERFDLNVVAPEAVDAYP